MLPLGLALALAMLVAWAIAVQLLTTAIERRLDARLDNATATLAGATFPFSADLIARLDELIGARIAFLTSSGEIGLSTGGTAANTVLEQLRVQPLETVGDSIRFFDLDGPEQWRAAVRRLPEGLDDRFTYVAAMASRTTTRNVARESAMLLGAAMFAALVVLAGIAAMLSRSITRPVTELARMADRIAEGERSISADIDERNEIGLLARALNRMSERLGDYEADLADQSRLTALGELASRMAHELRNPLTAIKMQLQLLEERTSEPERARIAGVLDEIRRLELIVNSSLAIGGAQALNPTPSDLDRLLDEVVTLVGPSLAHRGIDLQTAFADLPTVAVDGDRIKQVLLNLVNNAADELEGGGQILLAATPDGPHAVSIMVEDSGPGLPGEIERRRSGKSLGLGLGLQISREIVERHGGELLLGSSESLGGAKFTIRLPANIMTADGSEDR